MKFLNGLYIGVFLQIFLALPSLASDAPLPFSVLKAIDMRDEGHEGLQKAVKSGHSTAILGMGMIGTKRSCMQLVHILKSNDRSAAKSAATALGFCRHPEWVAPLSEAYGQYTTAVFRAEILRSLGLIGSDEARHFIAKSFAETTDTEIQQGALWGYMQSIVYASKSVADLPEMDWEKVVSLLNKPKTAPFAIYLTRRIGGFETVLPAAAYQRLMTGNSLSLRAKIDFLRLAPAYGTALNIDEIWYANRPTDKLVRAGLLHKKFTQAFIQALGGMTDDSSFYKLKSYLQSGTSGQRRLALDALASRKDERPEIAILIDRALDDSSQTVRVAALGHLFRAGDAEAKAMAWSLLTEDVSYFEAAHALSLLNSDGGVNSDGGLNSDAGAQEKLATLLPKLSPPLKRDAEALLKPREDQASAAARPTPPIADAESYSGQEIYLVQHLARLTTTKGEIVLRFNGVAKSGLTSSHFISLIQAGGMDGMIWHRVIPNFVAQAGNSEQKLVDEWGAIRDEWGGVHAIGTLGLATAGKDTGSAQFFINLNGNQHLDGRYTVFGRVVSGLDVAFALEEGDQIIKAEMIVR